MTNTPVLWSFRRCPYAMRARLAIASSGLRVELREILLRDKPQAFLETSPSATVPALRVNAAILDESLDIMIWALKHSDPNGLLHLSQEGWDLIATFDGPFKAALDHTKYATRYPDKDAGAERAKASRYLVDLNQRLAHTPMLFGTDPSIADLAIFPFVRQFANIDRSWFDQQPWPDLINWLNGWLDSQLFASVMNKYRPWSPDDTPVWFPVDV